MYPVYLMIVDDCLKKIPEDENHGSHGSCLQSFGVLKNDIQKIKYSPKIFVNLINSLMHYPLMM